MKIGAVPQWGRARAARILGPKPQYGIQGNFFPWQGGPPGPQIDLVTGWLDDQSQTYWGRPVDVKPANDGSLLISDDESGTILSVDPSG